MSLLRSELKVFSIDAQVLNIQISKFKRYIAISFPDCTKLVDLPKLETSGYDFTNSWDRSEIFKVWNISSNLIKFTENDRFLILSDNQHQRLKIMDFLQNIEQIIEVDENVNQI